MFEVKEDTKEIIIILSEEFIKYIKTQIVIKIKEQQEYLRTFSEITGKDLSEFNFYECPKPV